MPFFHSPNFWSSLWQASPSSGASFEITLALKNQWLGNDTVRMKKRCGCVVYRHHPCSDCCCKPDMYFARTLRGDGIYKSRPDAVGVSRPYYTTVSFGTKKQFNFADRPTTASCQFSEKTRDAFLDPLFPNETLTAATRVTGTSRHGVLYSLSSTGLRPPSKWLTFRLHQKQMPEPPGLECYLNTSVSKCSQLLGPEDVTLDPTIEADCSL